MVGYLAVGMMTDSGLSMIEPSEEDRRAAAIFQLNQDTPRDVGNGTQLDRVVAVGEGIQYQFTLTQLFSDDINPAEYHDFIYEASRSQICTNPRLVGFFDSEASYIEYQVSDQNGVLLTVIRFDKSDCE